MNDDIGYMPRTESNKIYTGTEFDNLTGYVTGNYVSEWTDRRGNRWRSCVTVVNLGRPDRGIVADDVDVELAPERLPLGKGASAEARYQESLAATRERRHGALLRDLGAYMQEHGPSTLGEMLPVTGWRDDQNLTAHLRMFPEVYVCYRKNPQVWGLHGQHYEPQGKLRPLFMRVWDALLEYGPMTAQEISCAVEASKSATDSTLRKDKGITFVKVGVRATGDTGGAPSTVWGLKEAA